MRRLRVTSVKVQCSSCFGALDGGSCVTTWPLALPSRSLTNPSTRDGHAGDHPCHRAPLRIVVERISLVFTVEQRNALRERLLRLAAEDERVVAGAAVGSLAVDAGDRFSDLDLTFGIADDVPVAAVLD